MNFPEFENIYLLLEKHLQGKLSPVEQQALEQWLDASPENLSFFRSIDDPATLLESIRLFYEVRQNMRARLELSIPELREMKATAASMTPVVFLKKRWFRYAAVITVMLSCAGYYWYSQRTVTGSNAEKQPPLAVAIQPGGNKAYLTLADGSMIMLDTAANGQLLQQGNTRILKLAGGAIAYETNGETSSAKNGMNTMTTPPGGQYQLTLPDGTKVWLNAASSITYPTAFTGTNRTVSVTGEAYFEVAKKAHQIFTVALQGMTVRALGTSFNINAYSEEPVISTTLMEGVVEISGRQLTPGQQLQMKDNKIVQVLQADLEQTIAWKNGFFRFNRTDIKTVMRQIARWYDVEVLYEGKIPTDRFVGELPMNAPVEEVLRALGKIQVHFRIEGKKIVVTP